MATNDPITKLAPQFSSSGDLPPTPWKDALARLEQAQVYWLTTVRPDGRPHVTPLVAVWMDGALYVCTGPEERKAKNLAHNPHCIVTTGCNVMQGLDVVVEGDAVRATDYATLQRLAQQFSKKYAPPFQFTATEDGFGNSGGGIAWVYEVRPTTAFGFGKGETFSQTSWRF